ncbi:MAG: preprotein translocase subunit SecE [Ruminococcus sp.]|nr:preprotein translocase subunit SecE [Ruminococcus sp.]
MAKKEKDALTEVSEEKETKKDKKAKADKSDKKDKKDEKKSGGVGKWFADLKREFKMVTWPTKDTVMINSGIVLGTIVISSLFVGLLDTGLLELMKFLLNLGQNS